MVKVFALFRFCIVYIFKSDVHLPKLSFIGWRSVIRTVGKGSIRAAGKIRLDACSEMVALGRLQVGNNLVINSWSRVIAHESISIGNNVVIARFVSILDHDHDIIKDPEIGSIKFEGYKTAPVKIGSNVWIGDKATVIKGVTIGDNVVIGANSVVTKDIPSNCIAAGIPAKVIKHI